MPSKTPAQHNLMEAVKHNPAFAAKVGIPQSVGAEFADADKAAGKFMSQPRGILHPARLKILGKRKKRMPAPHSQTHALPFGSGGDDSVP